MLISLRMMKLNSMRFCVYQQLQNVHKKSSNDEQKEEKITPPLIDTEPTTETSEDYNSITPFVHKMVIETPKDDDHELNVLREEVQRLKAQHAEEMNHFKNKINAMKHQASVQRQKSRLSMQIDEDIVAKQIRTETDEAVHKLQSEMMQKQQEQSSSIQSLQLRHAKELEKLSFKLQQKQQLHTLELKNIRSTHQFETEQLKAQIRAFTGSLERESRKDAKIQELTEENEELKV